MATTSRNFPIEILLKTMKAELVYHRRLKARIEARVVIFN